MSALYMNLVCTCNASAVGLYHLFSHPDVVKECKRAKFVNASFTKRGSTYDVVIHLYNTLPADWKKVQWPDIDCRSVDGDIKGSPCKVGSSKKVFYRCASTLKDYIQKLANDKISKSSHVKLFAQVFKIVGPDFVNHNRDVKLLHFKTPDKN